MSTNPEVEALSYSWDWDAAEYARVARAVQRHSKLPWLARMFLWVVVAVFSLGSGLVLINLVWGDRDLARSMIPWLGIIALWFLLLIWWTPRQSAKTFRKLNTGRLHLSITDTEIQNGSETISSRLDWATIERAVETREVLLLFYSGNCALYLPKRAVPSTDVPIVRALVRSKLGSRAMLLDSH